MDRALREMPCRVNTKFWQSNAPDGNRPVGRFLFYTLSISSMNIYSWNMLFNNKRLDDALEFIRRSDFDFFCLQEVPESFLKRLQTLPFHVAYATDVDRISPRAERIYLVTLSRHPIENQREVSFPDYLEKLPWRSRFFVFLMRPLGWTRIKNRSCFYLDANVKGQVTRIFNLHLILANPQWRLEEFERAMAERNPSLPTIVCGDFNVLESPRVSILNWILGGRIGDTVLWNRERITIEQRFISHELTNPLRAKSTHPLSRSQLDHILVSHHLNVREASVIPERYGSDHHPIFTRIEA